MRTMKPRITFRPAERDIFEVSYDGEVVFGKIMKNSGRYMFYPEDFDGLSYYVLINVAKKVHDLDNYLTKSDGFDELI